MENKPKEPKETDGFFNIPTEPKKGVKEIEKEIEIENEKMTCLLFGPFIKRQKCFNPLVSLVAVEGFEPSTFEL